eukprot:9341298-Pyramimonas_sp.AAC.1
MPQGWSRRSGRGGPRPPPPLQNGRRPSPCLSSCTSAGYSQSSRACRNLTRWALSSPLSLMSSPAGRAVKLHKRRLVALLPSPP